MKAQIPKSSYSLWRDEYLFNIDFAGYKLSHHSFPRHFHDHYVIELVVSGADRFYCDGKEYTAIPGDIIAINPGEIHTGSTIADDQLTYFSFYPDRERLKKIADHLEIMLTGEFYFPKPILKDATVATKLKSLYCALTNKQEKLLQQELFYDCMHELLVSASNNLSDDKCPSKDPRVLQVRDFLNTHFKEDISLEQMSSLININPFHLVRLFKKIAGITPYDYLINVRTEHAKQMLKKGHKVNEAAHLSGFYDSSHLNRLLRRNTAMSPKSFLSSKGQYHTIL